MLGAASAYARLRVDGHGSATGNASFPIVLPESGSDYVNIHESAAAMNTMVAGGDVLVED